MVTMKAPIITTTIGGVAAAALALALTSCGASHPAAQPSAALAPAQATVTPAPSAAAHSGPFRIAVLYCGKFTAAQQAQFGTSAAGGLVFRYVNTSGAMIGAPSLDVNFLVGTQVVGSNYGGTITHIRPGQSAEAEVDALNNGAQDITFKTCDPVSYYVQDTQGGQPPSYTP